MGAGYMVDTQYSESQMEAASAMGDIWYYNTTPVDSKCAAGTICHAEIEVLKDCIDTAYCDAHNNDRYHMPCWWGSSYEMWLVGL